MSFALNIRSAHLKAMSIYLVKGALMEFPEVHFLFSTLQALQCIGDLVVNHPQNRDALANKALGEEPQVEPALNSILRIILRTSSTQEFIAADYVFKSFCEVCMISLIVKQTILFMSK